MTAVTSSRDRACVVAVLLRVFMAAGALPEGYWMPGTVLMSETGTSCFRCAAVTLRPPQ